MSNQSSNIEQSQQVPLWTEVQLLYAAGLEPEEIKSIQWLRQWYQSGGSDRAPVVRHWEFLRLLIQSGRLEV